MLVCSYQLKRGNRVLLLMKVSEAVSRAPKTASHPVTRQGAGKTVMLDAEIFSGAYRLVGLDACSGGQPPAPLETCLPDPASSGRHRPRPGLCAHSVGAEP